jgi:hypothetical protein
MSASLSIQFPTDPLGDPLVYLEVPQDSHMAAWGVTEGCTVNTNATGMSVAMAKVTNPGENETITTHTVNVIHKHQEVTGDSTGRWMFWIRWGAPVENGPVYQLTFTATKTAGGTVSQSVRFKFKPA